MNNNESEMGDEYDELQYYGICVSETSLSCLPVWKTENIIWSNHKPPAYFVNFRDENDKEYFVEYFPEEDGNFSPKYSTYPPSFLAKGYSFKGCSSNGLLHFHDNKLSHHALWNPTTCEYKILPEPFVEPHLKSCVESFAMWSDHRFENYKLLRLVKNYFKKEAIVSTRESCQIDLYSLRTNSWKRIPATEFCYFDRDICACANGVFYCMASLKGTCDHVILAFDFSTETLSSLPLPENSKSHESYVIEYSFVEYRGLLSVLKCFYHEVEGNPDTRNYELWIMSDGSWTRESVFHAHEIDSPSMFSHDGKLLYFTCSEETLVVFNRATGKLKRLGVERLRSCPTMIPFFKSFVQLNGISCSEEKQEKQENYEDMTEKDD